MAKEKQRKQLMHSLSKHYITTLFILMQNCLLFAQYHITHNHDSTGHSPDYLPVQYAYDSPHEFTELHHFEIDTAIIDIHQYNPLLKTQNYYQHLGILGQAHQNIYFTFDKEINFTYHTLPYPLYYKSQKDIKLYDLHSTYTKLSYIYGLPEEDHFNLEFAQKLKQIQIAVNMYANYNAGYFLHQNVKNLVGDATIRYENPKKTYGFRATYILNRFNNFENGGLQRSYDYLENATTNKKSFRVNTSRATMEINLHDALFQQYVNLKDKQGHYYGTFTHTLQYKRYSSLFTDVIDSTQNYPLYYVTDVDSLLDSTRNYSIINSLQFSNFSPYSKISDKKYFIHLAGGIMHEYINTPWAPLKCNTLTPFVRTQIRLFSIMDLWGKFSYSFMSYNRHDAIAKMGAEWAINRKENHLLGVQAQFYRTSPDYQLSYIQNSCFQWDTIWKKQNIAKLGVYWKYKKYNAEFNYYVLNKLVILNNQIQPYQLQNTVSLIQGKIYLPFHYKGFGSTANLMLQYSNNDSIQVPLFAFKLSTYYVFNLFKRKMQLQIGADCAYNTSYYADQYCPNINSFYLQNNIEVGNFFYFDAFVNIRVNRIYLFFRIGNILSPIQKFNMFSTPNFPVNDYHISLGVNWRFHD